MHFSSKAFNQVINLCHDDLDMIQALITLSYSTIALKEFVDIEKCTYLDDKWKNRVLFKTQ